MSKIEFQVGELIENRYRVLSVAGSGGMGTLYCVSDEAQDGEIVALKMVRLVGAREVRERVEHFRCEFQLLTQLRHPNLVSVYDYGITTEGELYFTMEWVEGQDLDPHGRRLTLGDSVPIVVQICRALAYLHSQGVIHGDLKPANVLMLEGQIKIVDFGIALEIRPTEARAHYYSLGYSAPEMKELRPIDHRADLYSLGTLWYALLVGEPPLFMFNAERMIRFVLDQVLQDQGQIPPAVGDVIARLLATSPRERYASANEVIVAVNEITGSKYALETRETAGSYALRTRFVDREAEIEVFRALWEQAQSSAGKLVLISGESGVGKSRLVREMEVQAELEGARVVWGQCVERGGDVYQPWREVLRVLMRYVEIADGPGLDIKRVGPVLATILPELWERDQMAGLRPAAKLDSQAAQRRLQDAIVLILWAAAELRPTMVVIENAQWASDATLAMLSFLAHTAGQIGLLVCVTYRSEEVDTAHPLSGLAGDRVQHIPMQTLSPKFTADLVCSMLGLEELPALLAERVQQTTGGNALFVQELIRSLAAEGEVLRRTVAGWQLDQEALQSVQLPESIRQVIERRLGQLSLEAQQVLGWAAVMGTACWEGGIAEIGEVARSQVRVALRELLGLRLLLVRDESAFAGEQEYLFLNPTLREVSYERIARERRLDYHRRVADWLLARSAEEIGAHLGLIAEHLEQAGQMAQAVIYLRRAGEQATEQFANTEVVGYLSRALDLMPDDALVERYTLLLSRERVYHLQGTREAQAGDLMALQELAELVNDDEWRAEVALRRANYAEEISDYGQAISAAKTAIAAAQAAQDTVKEAQAYRVWGLALLRQGEYKESHHHLEQCLTLARAAGDYGIQARSLHSLGLAAYFQHDFARARRLCEQAIDLYREIGDQYQMGHSLNNLGIVLTDSGDYSDAGVCYEESLCIAREIGDRPGETFLLVNLGWTAGMLGEYVKANSYFDQALYTARETGNQSSECGTLSNLGWIFYHMGDDEASLTYSQQALRIAQKIGSRRWEGYALTNLGHALASLGRPEEAANAYQRALDLRRELGQHQLAMDSLTGLASVSLARGDLVQARSHVEEILRNIKEQGLDGAEEPFQVYLTCYHVLRAGQDPRARVVLEKAHRLLQEQAAKISDEAMRRSFLENVSAHREIVAEWE